MASNSKGEKRAEYLANVMMDAGELYEGVTDLPYAMPENARKCISC
jgi:hypothetical protein